MFCFRLRKRFVDRFSKSSICFLLCFTSLLKGESSIPLASNFPTYEIQVVAVHRTPQSNGGMEARDLNDAGLIVGAMVIDNVTRGFVWEQGQLKLLPEPRDGFNSTATALNQSGTIVGHYTRRVTSPSKDASAPKNEIQPLMWKNGQVVTLGILPHHEKYREQYEVQARALGVNIHDQIVGVSPHSTETIETGRKGRAFLWNDGSMQDLLELDAKNTPVVVAEDINDAGEIVGWLEYLPDRMTAFQSYATRAFLWKDGVLKNIPTLSGGVASRATAINNQGQIVGWEVHGSDVGTDILFEDFKRAFLWDKGMLRNVGYLRKHNPTGFGPWDGEEEDPGSFATDINDAGQVVGVSGPIAFIYQDLNGNGWPELGETRDLNELIPVDEAEVWDIEEAVAINNKGQILVYAEERKGDDEYVLLLDPAHGPLHKYFRKDNSFRWSHRLPPPSVDSNYYDNGAPAAEKVELGKALFFDKILSGNQNISCATCHHPVLATGDGLSLPIGEGGRGLGLDRTTGELSEAIPHRVGRHSTALFNLGAKEFTSLFFDGRVEKDNSKTGGFRVPFPETYVPPAGLDNILAVQALFPVLSDDEMAGKPWENEQGLLASRKEYNKETRVHAFIASKLQAIPEYVELFKRAYPDDESDTLTYTQAANALAAFQAVAWRSDKSPFDRYLNGEKDAMSEAGMLGMGLFYGKANCYSCHSGTYQTDHRFHSIAMPHLGSGKGDGHSGFEDFGRARETRNVKDVFKFRTLSLRNVELTAPYGHSGAYATLRGIVEHHLDPVGSLYRYDYKQAILQSRPDLDALDFEVQKNPVLLSAIAQSNALAPMSLTDGEVDALIAFLHELTDPSARDLSSEVPSRVPSGLPVED